MFDSLHCHDCPNFFCRGSKEINDNPDSDKLYDEEAWNDFRYLLDRHSSDDKEFQAFFEKNPCFVPNDAHNLAPKTMKYAYHSEQTKQVAERLAQVHSE